ncbi:Cytochrome P480 monooxygenase [Paramyrothecium foliicola]|nr:Cytochrome P480 monooxygenase [Paramyrothecium foliicola]
MIIIFGSQALESAPYACAAAGLALVVSLTAKLFEAYHVLIKDDWLDVLESLHHRHGKAFDTVALQVNRPIVRIGPNELHFSDHIFCLDLHKQPDLYKCDNYYGILSYLLGGLPSPSSHAERKSVVQPLFSGGTLADFSVSFLNDHIESLMDQFSTLADGHEVNATHLLWAYTNDVMASYVLDSDVGYLKSPDLSAIHDATRAFNAIDLATVLRSMWPVKMLLDTVPSLRRFSPLVWIDELIRNQLDPVMKSATKQEKPTQSVLERLWQQLPDERIVVHEMAQAIFIGNESLLSNLTVLLHHLIRNPECVKRLRTELDSLDIGLFGHRVWRDPQVMHLKYLNAVCRESTRMSAPVWHRQPRQVPRPVQFEHYVIPPMVSIWLPVARLLRATVLTFWETSMSFTLKLLEHDPSIHHEPSKFKPERWLGTGDVEQKPSITFGTGTRTCLGQFLARHVLRKTLAGLVYNFDLSFVNREKDRREGYRYLNTYPKRGREGHLMLRLRPRFRAQQGWL